METETGTGEYRKLNRTSNTSTEFARKLITKLSGAYSSFSIERSAGVYLQEIKAMAAEFGMQRTEAAITQAIRQVPEFAPSPAKLREFVPDAPSGHRDRCARCKPSDGWIEIPIPGQKVPQVARCRHNGTLKFEATGTFGGKVYKAAWHD